MKILYLLSIFFLLSLTSCDIAEEEQKPPFAGTWVATGTDDVLDDLGVPTGDVYTWRDVWTLTKTTSEYTYTTSKGDYIHEKGTITIIDDKSFQTEYLYSVDQANNETPIPNPSPILSLWAVEGNILKGIDINADGSIYYEWEYIRK